jgi:hypothetical protein
MVVVGAQGLKLDRLFHLTAKRVSFYKQADDTWPRRESDRTQIQVTQAVHFRQVSGTALAEQWMQSMNCADLSWKC